MPVRSLQMEIHQCQAAQIPDQWKSRRRRKPFPCVLPHPNHANNGLQFGLHMRVQFQPARMAATGCCSRPWCILAIRYEQLIEQFGGRQQGSNAISIHGPLRGHLLAKYQGDWVNRTSKKHLTSRQRTLTKMAEGERSGGNRMNP